MMAAAIRNTVLLLAAVLVLAPAAARVDLEIVGEREGGAALGFHEWMQALSRAGVHNVRFRTAESGDKVNIDMRGTPDSPQYVVTAMLTARDELVVPGARFKRSEMGRLAVWLADIAERGPPGHREARSAFGLTPKQLEQVHDDLARPTGFTTRGLTRGEAVRKLSGRLTLPVRSDGDLPEGDDKITEELSELSSGTALACLLRPAGWCLVPRQTGEGLVYAVAKARLDHEVWPIGWPSHKPPADVLPALYESHNVNVQNVSATRLLETVGKQLKLPILMDYPALARHGIDPDKALVSMPQGRTTYSIALNKLLFKAGLKYEIRLDEADKPFLWVTSVKPV